MNQYIVPMRFEYEGDVIVEANDPYDAEEKADDVENWLDETRSELVNWESRGKGILND